MKTRAVLDASGAALSPGVRGRPREWLTPWRRALVAGLIAGAACAWGPRGAATAADVVKNNTAGLLSSGTSWTSGTAPTSSDVAVFDSTYTTTGTLTAGTVVDWGGIRVVNPGGAVLVNTGTIGTGTSGIDMSSATVDMVIKNYKFNASQTWDIGSGRTFRIGDTTATSSGGTQRAGTFTNNSAGATITKTGAGTVILDTGTTSLGNVNWTVNNGLIRAIWNSPAAWGTGTITLGGGGIAVGTPFNLSVGNWTWNNAISLSNSTSSYIDNQNVAGNNRWLKLEGVISGAGNVEFRDTGAGFDNSDYGFILTAVNTFTGTMAIATAADVRVGGVAAGTQNANTGNNGTLGASTAPVVNNGTLSFSRLDAHTVANPISGVGALRVGLSATIGTTTATQDVLLSGSNSYSGGTTLWNGRLRVGNASALGAMSGAVTLNSGTLDLGGYSVAVGLLTGSSGATITSSTTGSLVLTASSASSGTFAGVIAAGSGTIGLTKQGAGTLTLSGSNAYTGVTTVAGGVLSVAADSNLGGAPGSATAGSLMISGGTLAATTGFTLNANRGLALGPTSGSGIGTVDVASGQTLAYAGIAADNPGGTGGLTKTGSGTLSLSGSNSYSAGTTLNAGQLTINNAAAIGTGTFTIAGGSIDNTSGGLVALSANNPQRWNGDYTFGGSNPLNLGTGAVTLSANRQVTLTSSTLTVGGTVSGAFSLTKAGPGTIQLDGPNTFTGGFILTGGTAVAGNGTAFGRNGSTSGAITIRDGTLNLNGQYSYQHTDGARSYLLNNQNLTFGGVAGGVMVLSDTGTTAYGFGVFNAGSNIAYDATNNPGTASVTAKWSSVGSSGAVTKTVTVGDSSATSIEIDFIGQMSRTDSTDGSNATIQKLGAGAMRISGTNAFPILQVTAGRLIVNNANALGSRRTNNGTVENLVTVDGGTLDLNGFSPAIGGLSGGGVTTGTITNTAAASSSVLTTGSSNAATTFGGRIVDGVGTVGLVKQGTGVLTLSGSNDYSGGTTLASGTILLGNGSALGTASSPLALNAGTLDLRGNSAAVGLLSGSSGATITSSTAGSVVLTASSAASATFSGMIAAGAGTIGFTKQGAGTLTLAASNAYTGATTITGGTLAVSSDANLGTAPGAATAGHLTIAGALSATAPFSLSSNRGITLGPAGGDGDGTIAIASGTLAYGGIIANNGAGTDGLVKVGAGSLRLTGVSTYSGATTISAGRLEVAGGGQLGSGAYAGAIANGGALRVETSANQTLSGGISGVGSLEKSGAGRLTLLGANSYSGPTSVDLGRLVVNGLVTSSTITVGTGGYLGGSGTTSAVTLAGGVISPGNSPGTLTTGDLLWSSTSAYDWEMYDYQGTAGTVTGWDLVNGGALTVTGTGFTFNLLSLSGTSTSGPLPPERWSQTTSGTFRMVNFTSISAPSGTWWNINSSGFNPFSSTLGTFSLDVGATSIDLVYTHTPPAAYIWTAGSGVWSTGSNWNTDPETPEGSPEIEFSGAGGTSTNDIVSGTLANQIATVTGLTFTGSAAGSYTVDGNTFNLGSLGVVNESSFQQTVANGMTLAASSLANAAVSPLTLSGTIDTAGFLFTVTGSSNTTLSGVITGSGSLTKLDVGTLTLTGTNTYTGLTTITGGTLVVGNGSTSGELPGGGVTTSATLVFDRSDAVTFGGGIGGTGSLVKLNGNTLTLTGSNSYSGATTISGGTLAFSSAASQSLSGGISGAGALAKAGAGTLALTGSSDYAGGTTITAGTLQLGSGGATGSITGAVTNNSVFAFNRSDSVTFGEIIGGSGSVTQAGAGSTTLTAVNTYAGSTTISSGTLAIGGSGQLGSGSYAGGVTNAGVFSIETSSNQTLSGTVSGAGSLRKSGAGTLTLTAANTHAGGSMLTAGTLLVGNNAALGTGTATLEGGVLSSDGGTARTLSNALVIGGDLTLGDATKTGLLTFSGNVGLAAAVRQLTLPTDVTFSGTVTNGGITKAGAGTLRLSGSSTYTLGTTLVSGTIVAANGGSLGSSGTVTLNTAATGAADTSLLIDASGTSVTIARAITVANQGSGVTTIGSGSLASTNQATFSGPITLAKDVTLVAATSGDRTQFTGGIGGTGNVTVSTVGTGRVIFVTGTNSFAGNVTVSPSSRLQLGDGAASTVNLIPDAANVTIGAGGRLQLSKGANSETINALLGSGTVEINNGSAGLNGTLIVGSAGGSGTFSGVLANGNGVLLFTKQGTGTQVLTASSSYTGATILSQGTLRVTGAGVLGGQTGSVTDGNNILFNDVNSNASLEFETAANLGPADQVRFRNSGGTAGQGTVLRYVGTTNQTVSKTLQCDTTIGMRLESDSVGGALTFNGAFSQAGRPLYLGGSGTGDNELASVFASSSVITKRDAGTWVLSGSNTYSGGTELIGGTLKVASLSNIGTFTTGNTGYLAVKNGASFVYTGSGTETTTRSLFLDNGAATITMANAAGSLTWNDSTIKNQAFTKAGPGLLSIGGALTGSASVTLNAGTLWLTSTVGTYTGTTAINGGSTLGFANGALGSGTIAMNGGTLQWLTSNTQDVSSRLQLVSGTTATFDTNGNNVTFGSALAGGAVNAAVVKIGAGKLTISGNSAYTGSTTVAAGTLLVNGTLANTSGVTVSAGAVFGGSGSIAAALGGAGLVSPGNSPGITTANALDPTGGLDFAFEFTGTGSPVYGSGTASVNDVLRLTSATPIVANLASVNVIDVLLDVSALVAGDAFRGGFYIDIGGSFTPSIENGIYQYWVSGTGGGTDRTFNGRGYYSLANFDSALSVTTSTVAESANFGGGTVNGSVTQFIIVPEPGALSLLGLGVAMTSWTSWTGWTRWKRRQTAAVLRDRG